MSNIDGQLIAAVLASHTPTGRRIVSLLEEGGIEVLCEATRGDDLEQGLGGASVDALVLACSSSSNDAKRAIRDLKRRFLDTPLVAVVEEAGASRVSRAALDANADGVVYQGLAGKALVPSVLAVSAQHVVLPRNEYRHSVPVVLSHRERQVLRLAVDGLTNDSIASRLYLSRSTVKSHLTSAFAKLSVRSRSEAAVLLSNPDEPASRLISSIGGSEAEMAAAAAGG
jgi:DNA-binding NarL/FixJ family response regulator